MRRTLALALLAALAWCEPAAAQPRPRTARPPRPVTPSSAVRRPRVKKAPAEKRTLFTGRIGLGVARRLLGSSDAEERSRGLERLGAVGTAGALELLGKALEPGGAAKTNAERLVAVRALARHTGNADVRLALVRALTGVGSEGDRGDALAQLVRETAALALARSGRRDAQELLGKALRQEGPIAEAAALAIEAHPPSDVAVIVGARGTPTVALVRLLGRLGDQRAFHGLRQIVQRGSAEVRAEAAVALTRLGDFETVALARHWLSNDSAPPFRIAAARILAMARDAKAGEATAALLGDSATYEAGLELALQAALPGAIPALVGQLGKRPHDAGRILAAIGRAGGEPAARALERQLAHADHGALAAYALALAPGDASTSALERALGSAAVPARRNAARAAVLRRRALGASVSGTDAALDRLLASSDAADRAAGAWGRAALQTDDAVALIGSPDPAIVRAAGRQAFVPDVAVAAARRLAREADASLKTALASALAAPAAASRVPTAVLLELIDAGGAAMPIAAQALAARDTIELRQRIEPLAASPDALVRSSVALGLGDSREPSAVGLLARAYRFETDPRVRHAIVVALSRRGERTRERTLSLAADLDPDRRVREAARLAGAGQRLARLDAGRGTLWLALSANTRGAVAEHAVELGTAPGPVLPLAADPDGAVVAGNLPAGPVQVRLAPTPRGDKARQADDRQRKQAR